jgi:hypothetical protein
LLGWFIGVDCALGAPSAEALQAEWERWRPQLEASAVFPLRLTATEWETLAKGQVARRRERLEGTDRVIGVLWVAADLDTTWLALQDPHETVLRGFYEEELAGSTFQAKVAYQRIDLPWPLAPRQWVITVVNNLSLIQATDGRLWERTWTLSDRRGAAGEVSNGVWLDVNDGGWWMCEAAGGVLLGYHVRSVVGGAVPDEMATRWSYATITGMLEKVAARTAGMAVHYTGDHAPMRRPDGTAIPVR